MNAHDEADEQTLMAYLDGELAEAETRALEHTLASHPEAEARLRDLAFADAMLRASVRALAARGAQAISEPPAGKATVIPLTRRHAGGPWSLAAGLVLAIAAGALGYAIRPALDPVTVASGTVAEIGAGPASASEAALQSGLEHEASGRASTWRDPRTGRSGGFIPVRTWRTEEGRFCREFEAWHGAGEAPARERGVACRAADGQWRVRVRYYPD